MVKKVECNGCIHKKICDLWVEEESQNASCYVENCKETLQDIIGYDVGRLSKLVEADKSGRCVILGIKPDLRPGVNVSRCFIVDDDGEIIEDNVFSAEVGPDSSGKMNVIYNTFDSGDFEEGEVGHRVFWDENSAKKASEASGKRDM